MPLTIEELASIKSLIREATTSHAPFMLLGLIADRPPSGIKNRMYFATDVQKLYYDDCDAGWKETSSLNDHTNSETFHSWHTPHHVAFVQGDHDALANPHHLSFTQPLHDALANPHHSNINDHVQLHKAAHISGGGDAFASTDLIEALIKRVRESGGADLALGAILDGQNLQRSGLNIVGVAPGGGGSSVTRISGASGAAGADITWQRLTTTPADITTITLSAPLMTTTGLGVGLWKFKYYILYQTAALATGIAFGVNHTGTVSKFRARWTHITTGGAAATGIGDDVAAVVAGQLAEGKSGVTLNAIIGSASAGVATINANIQAILEGIIVVTVSGDLQLKIASEVAGSAVRITADTILELQKIA